MNNKTLKILDEWAKFTDFDENRKSFVLGNVIGGLNYGLHKENESIKNIIENFDQSGNLGVIKAKAVCKSYLEQAKPNSIMSIIEDSSLIDKCKKMWNTFNSEYVKEIEDEFSKSIKELLNKITDGKLIGNDAEFKIDNNEIMNIVTSISTNLQKLKIDIFEKGGEPSEEIKICKKICVTDTMKECLDQINKSKDSIYLCYITLGNSAYGYFCFVIKNNGNIISISERIDEVFPGQHERRRNARETESKNYNFFPYEIFKFADYDYKGYSTKHTIDKNRLELFNLGRNVYLPIVISMLLLFKMYKNEKMTGKKKYVLSTELNKLFLTSKSNNSIVAKKEESILDELTVEKIKDDECASKFDSIKGNFENFGYVEGENIAGVFINDKKEFIELYGNDFNLDYYNPELSLKLLDDGKSDGYISEYIGSDERLNMLQFYMARQELANQIKSNMEKEYESFGGKKAINEWYENLAREKYDVILSKFIKNYIERIENGEIIIDYANAKKENQTIKLIIGDYPTGVHDNIVLNEKISSKGYIKGFKCPITGTKSTMFFVFSPENAKDIANFTSSNYDEFPKILKGWSEWDTCPGNSILQVIDPVSQVSHIMSRLGSFSGSNNMKKFNLSIGLSKRGLSKLVKMYGGIDKKKMNDNLKTYQSEASTIIIEQ